MPQDTDLPSRGIDGVIASTSWKTIFEAKGSSDIAVQALGRLCERYRSGISAYIVGQARRWNPPATRAEIDDLIQSFLSPAGLGKTITHVKPEGGRFRAFLLTCIRNFVVDAVRARVPPPPEPPADTGLELAGPMPEPERQLDREIARACHRAAIDSLQDSTRGQNLRLNELLPFLFGKLDNGSYEQVAVTLQITTGAVSKAVHDLRQRYSAAFIREVGTIATSPAEVGEECRYLLGLLAEDQEI